MRFDEIHESMLSSLKTTCTDRKSRETSIPLSSRAPRPRERERMGVLSLGFMSIQGDLEEMERTKRTNQKTELKEKKGNRKPTKTKKIGNRKSTKKQEIHQKKKKGGATGSHRDPKGERFEYYKKPGAFLEMGLVFYFLFFPY